MPLVFVALLTAIAVMQISAPAVRAAADSGVYVDIRASETADAPVTERWKLYGASHALVIGIPTSLMNYCDIGKRRSRAVSDRCR